MSQACARSGIPARSATIEDGAQGDFNRPENRRRIALGLLRGEIIMLWFGITCSTWSVARRNDGRGPGPLRSEEYLYGFPYPPVKSQRRVDEANQQLRWMFDLCMLAARLQVPCVVENPETSRAWLTSEVCSLKNAGFKAFDLDFCQFGEPWKKGARLLAVHFDELAVVCKRCKGTTLCSASGKPHVIPKGKDVHGIWWTQRAQPYPLLLTEAIAGATKCRLKAGKYPPAASTKIWGLGGIAM